MLKKIMRNSDGFSLVEVLASMGILSLLIVGFVGSTTTIQSSTNAAYERSVSTQHANHVAELMRDAALSGTFPSNVTGSYPHNGTVSGLTSLSGETITVSYADVTADPLDATITVSYMENGARTVSHSIRTLITQRPSSSSSSSSSGVVDDGEDDHEDDEDDHDEDDHDDDDHEDDHDEDDHGDDHEDDHD